MEEALNLHARTSGAVELERAPAQVRLAFGAFPGLSRLPPIHAEVGVEIDSAYKLAYAALKALAASKTLDADLSEADTRAKLIDPLFKDVLGWPESAIQREEHCAEGFADYTLRERDRRVLLVEAKRIKPRFDLPAGVAKASVTVGGASLSEKRTREALVQAAGYGASLGCPFVAVTNGLQFVVFQALLELPLQDRPAIVFTDLLKMDQFRRFTELLHVDSISDGSLQRVFLSFLRQQRLYTPIEFIDHPDRELRRNRFWSVLNHLATRVLEDRLETRLDIIKNCYVPTRESNETDVELRALLARPAPNLLRETSTAVKVYAQGRTSFGHAIEGAVKERKAGVFVFTGGVGSGKTTFLSRFEHYIEPKMVAEWCAWFHVDFLSSTKASAIEMQTELEAFVLRNIRQQLETKYSSEVPTDGAGLRVLFGKEIDGLKRTKLYRVQEDSDKYLEIVNSEIDRLFKSDRDFVRVAIHYLVSRGRRVVFVLDNSDQLGEDFQERVFLYAKSLQDEFSAISIVSLREEKFYAAYYRGVFNAFPTSKFHLGSPDLQEVLRRRLEYGISLMKQFPADFVPGQGEGPFSLVDCEDLLRVFIRSVTKRNRNIVRLVDSVAAGNIRFGLEIFRDFVGSGNTDVDKILQKLRESGGYVVPFHEFVKSIMLNNREIYRSGSSVIANVFARSGAAKSSHFTALRILEYLQQRLGAISSHGPGFVDAMSMRADYASTHHAGEDFDQIVGHLVRKELVESEPPLAVDAGKAVAFKIGAAGAYYLRFLCQSFAYLDLVIQDTPSTDEKHAKYLASVARYKDLEVRVQRVRAAVSYLVDAEAAELSCVPVGAAFTAPLMPGIQSQVEHEIRVLERVGRYSVRATGQRRSN